MKLFNIALAICTLAGALTSSPVFAQSLRCHGDLASEGDAKASVLQKCGEPVFKETFCKPVHEFKIVQRHGIKGTVVTTTSCENVDEWTYNPGYGQFLTMLRFESGRLVSIRYGDRVK